MPQFEMEKDGEVQGLEFADLSPFVQGYLEAMFFTNEATGISMVDWTDPEVQHDIREGYADGDLPADAGFSDIYPGSLKTAIASNARRSRKRPRPCWTSPISGPMTKRKPGGTFGLPVAAMASATGTATNWTPMI
jgi:hypothetical protein